MPEIIEEVYQDTGFELVVYKQRKADPFKTCPNCGAKVFPVASVYDEWQARQSSLAEYDHCKKCKHIVQTTTRQRPDGNTTHQQYHHVPPFEMVIQLLAYSRHVQGRGITRLTINRRWWQAWRYPLTIGNQMPDRAPRVRPSGSADMTTSGALQDDQTRHVAPLPRYQPKEGKRDNPFTSRRIQMAPPPKTRTGNEPRDIMDILEDEPTLPPTIEDLPPLDDSAQE